MEPGDAKAVLGVATEGKGGSIRCHTGNVLLRVCEVWANRKRIWEASWQARCIRIMWRVRSCETVQEPKLRCTFYKEVSLGKSLNSSQIILMEVVIQFVLRIAFDKEM